MKNENELLIPPAAEEDPKANEVIRVWVAKGGQHVSLNPLIWKDPQAWGYRSRGFSRTRCQRV